MWMLLCRLSVDPRSYPSSAFSLHLALTEALKIRYLDQLERGSHDTSMRRRSSTWLIRLRLVHTLGKLEAHFRDRPLSLQALYLAADCEIVSLPYVRLVRSIFHF